MATDALTQALRQIALFAGLSPLRITEIARRADRIVYKPRQVITIANQPIDAAIVIFSGTAERISGPGLKQSPQQLHAGTIIAELAMLVEMVPASSVVALTQVRALRLARTEMHKLIAEDPTLGEHFITKAVARLKDVEASMRHIESELAAVLDQDVQESCSKADSAKTYAGSLN